MVTPLKNKHVSASIARKMMDFLTSDLDEKLLSSALIRMLRVCVLVSAR